MVSRSRMPPPSCTGISESSAPMMSLIAASLRGLPETAPFRSTTWSRRAPFPAHCAATLPGSFENTVADSMRPCSRRTQWPSFRSIAGMISMGGRDRLRIPGGEIAEEREPRGAAFLGMELRRENVIAGDRRGKGVRIPRRSRCERVFGRLAVVAVHEVEAAAVGDALPQRMRNELPHLVPAHVRNLEPRLAIERAHLPLEQCEPGRVALGAALEEHLLADAQAEEGLVARAERDRLAQSALPQRAHAVGHRALPGEHHP